MYAVMYVIALVYGGVCTSIFVMYVCMYLFVLTIAELSAAGGGPPYLPQSRHLIGTRTHGHCHWVAGASAPP